MPEPTILPPPVVPIPKTDEMTLPPTTTVEQDKVIYSQQRVNLIWERTQALIAIFVVFVSLSVASFIVVAGVMIPGKAPQELPNVFSLLLGTVFYFSRTNHAAIGGLGSKPEQKYIGR